MSSEYITNTLVAQLQPQKKQYEIRDSKLKGFLIRVNPSGGMSYVVQYDRGKRIGLGKVGVLKPTEAREKAMEILANYAKGIDPALERKKKSPLITLREFFDREYHPWFVAHYRASGEMQRYRVMKHFQPWLDWPLGQIKVQDFERWRSMALQTLKPNTVNHCLNTLKSIMNCAVKWEFLAAHPFTQVKKIAHDDTRVRYLSEKEEAALFQQLKLREQGVREQRHSANQWRQQRGYSLLPPIDQNEYADHLMPLVILAASTGLRQQELFTLRRSQVNLEQRYVSQLGKNAKIRHVPLNDVALATLSKWMRSLPNDSLYLFPSPQDESKPIGEVKRSWLGVLKSAGIEDFHWHDLRHHFASKLVMAGVDLNTVRDLLGHADMKMTLRYAHLAPEHKAEAVGKLKLAGV